MTLGSFPFNVLFYCFWSFVASDLFHAVEEALKREPNLPKWVFGPKAAATSPHPPLILKAMLSLGVSPTTLALALPASCRRCSPSHSNPPVGPSAYGWGSIRQSGGTSSIFFFPPSVGVWFYPVATLFSLELCRSVCSKCISPMLHTPQNYITRRIVACRDRFGSGCEGWRWSSGELRGRNVPPMGGSGTVRLPETSDKGECH
jgi:hypothetical protein